MDFIKLSVKHFIGDLPNIINTNFEKVKDTIEKFFDATTNTLKGQNGELNGNFSKIVCTSISTNNLSVRNNNETIAFAELLERIETLEETVKELNERIETLENTTTTSTTLEYSTPTTKTTRKRTSKQ